MEWKMWVISAIGTVILSAIIRALPAKKLIAAVTPWAHGVGVALSKMLLSWLPRSIAEQAENGVICTAIDVVIGILLAIREGLIDDNKERLARRK